MEKVILNAQKRTVTGRKVKNLRKDGFIPANVYGKKVKSLAVAVGIKDFSKVFAQVGETGLLELVIGPDKRPVLIHNVQVHPVDNKPLHIDFHQVDLKEKVTTKVPIVFTGESIAVKDKVGVLLNILTELEVEALPTDLPDKIEVDVGKLATIGQMVKVADIKVDPTKIKLITSADKDIVKVAPLVSKEAEQLAKEEAEKAAAAQAAAAPAPETQAGTTPTAEAKPAAEKTPTTG